MGDGQLQEKSKSSSESQTTSAPTVEAAEYCREMAFLQLMLPTLMEQQRQYNRMVGLVREHMRRSLPERKED